MTRTHAILAALLALTLGLTFWPMPETDEAEDLLVTPAERGAAASPAPRASVEPAPRAARALPDNARRFAAYHGTDLFPAQTFIPPPPPPPPRPPAPPPPPPQAPALPYTFMGAWTENGQTLYMLMRGKDVFDVRLNGTLPGGWRLDKATDEQLTLTYVSLNQPRSLRIAP